jgi:hypothetical protein
MMQPPPTPPGQTPSLILIEGLATSIFMALCFLLPRLGGSSFARIEHALGRLARKQGMSVAVVGCTAFLLRLAILPVCPIPLPFVPDDFSFLLSADTFAHGRLANPVPAMWTHFETIHLTMSPTYVSMYFPSNGLLLAASKILFGHPWYGLLIASSLMCAAICWMLQSWLPPTWALLGGALAILRLGLFSYWINTYSGGGCISALGGALILGSLPRLKKTLQLKYGLLLATGIVLLVLTRPYEGLLICIPAAGYLVHWLIFSAKRPSPALVMRMAAVPLALVIAAVGWLGYYDYRAFGKATTLPYTVDRAAYAQAPYYVWQPPRPAPVYRHEVMRRFYYVNELSAYEKIHTLSGFAPETLAKVLRGLFFFAGIALVPPLIMVRRVFLDRRIRFLMICIFVLMAGMLIQIFLLPHYLAPFTALFYAIGLQTMRHLRVWSPGDQPVGRTMVRLTVMLCIGMASLRLCAAPLHLMPEKWPPSDWLNQWYGPGPFGGERAQVQSTLEQMSGKQLVLVRYAANHNVLDEWVYNAADLDNSKVVWAREMDAAHNRELIEYYPDRHVWLVEPDAGESKLSTYAMPQAKPANTLMVSSIQSDQVKKESHD